jgi:cellulose synthase/poly-beta-1,6-N-acetylglucosamine synthase-like glycosyltransferase
MEVDKSPSVSVAVLTYGEYSELASTLKSIVAQDYPVAEIIVSDDGSGREFPSEVVDSYDGIVAFQQSAANVGTVAHMNSLASRLQGTYLKFIATGDALNSQDALTRLVRWAEKECTVVTTSQAMVCNRTLEKKLYPFPRKKQLARLGVTAPEQFTYLSAENCIGAAGTLFQIFLQDLEDFRKNIGF